jgi:hypothetical protein
VAKYNETQEEELTRIDKEHKALDRTVDSLNLSRACSNESLRALKREKFKLRTRIDRLEQEIAKNQPRVDDRAQGEEEASSAKFSKINDESNPSSSNDSSIESECRKTG